MNRNLTTTIRKSAVALVLCALSFGALAVPVTSPNPPEARIGLVLSGGGARGFAHIGVLQALEQLRVPVDLVAATSMGALVGGAYAAGYSPEQIRDITLNVHWPSMLAPSPKREQLAWSLKEDDRAGLGLAEVGLSKQGIVFPAEVIPAHELEMFLERSTAPVRKVKDLGQLATPFACMATDLRTGSRVVLQDDVNLPQAMRASMSIPGVFAPVRYGKHLLVDGGLVDNLPVVQARKMGAKRLIAVNVGTPIGEVDEVASIVDFMGQMITILTEQNVKESLLHIGSDDVLITPDLKHYTSADFQQAEHIIRLGYEAAMRQQDALKRFAVSPEEFERWRRHRAAHIQLQDRYTVDAIEVEGLSRINPEAVAKGVDLDVSEPLHLNDIEANARLIWADGGYSSVPYRFETGENNAEILVFEPKEKEWGFSTLRLGGNVQTNFRDDHTYNLLLAHTMTWLNAWGAEWRNEIQFGQQRSFLTQWTQPLGAGSPWFVRPFVNYRWNPFDIYEDSDTPIAQYRTESFKTGLQFGRALGRAGVANIDAGWVELKTVEEIGQIGREAKMSSPYIGGRFWYDTLDDASFPTKGLYLSAEASYYWDQNSRSGHVGSSEGAFYASALMPVALSPNWTLSFSGAIGRSETPGRFNLGGVFKLSGTPYGRFVGENMDLGRVTLMRRLVDDMSGLGMPLYVGASVEMGRTYDGAGMVLGEEDRAWKHAGSLFVGADTWIGPMYLVFGHTVDYGSAVVFYWGRLPL